MGSLSLAQPNLATCTHADIRAYFNNTWDLTELLFSGLRSGEAFHRVPDHGLRHPLIFYYGHPAALYINKFRVAGLIASPVNAEFEALFETGVDEMSWDDMSKNERRWPSLADVRAYRQRVYDVVLEVIDGLRLPVTMDDPGWAVFMGFEHERIHLETSSVLIRELPLHLVTRPPAWPPLAKNTSPDTVPAFVTIPAGIALLGKPRDYPSFGWDNEYGSRTVEIGPFRVATHLVTNREFHAFVTAGGYTRRGWWSDEGWAWRGFRNTKWPRFWVPTGPAGLHEYRLRTIFEEAEMPWDWPVCVNYHEAKAYCAWRSDVDGVSYHLPSEAQHHLMHGGHGPAFCL